MIVSSWYHIEEKLPEKSGKYLCMVAPTTRYGSHREIKFCWFNTLNQTWSTNWDEGEQRVAFWMDGNPFSWYDEINAAKNNKMETEAEQEAYKNLVEALERYNMILTLLSKK